MHGQYSYNHIIEFSYYIERITYDFSDATQCI